MEKLEEIKKDLDRFYKSELASIGIYKNQSLYFDYSLNETVLALSYNQYENKVFLYYRDKRDINDFYKYFSDLGCSKVAHQLVWDLRDKELIDIRNLLEIILFRTDNIIMNLKAPDHNKNSSDYKFNYDLLGIFTDINNNNVTSPYNLHQCSVKFSGANNRIYIDPHAKIRNLSIICLGSNARLIIGKTQLLSGLLFLGTNSSIVIEDNVSGDGVYMNAANDTSISVGHTCIFEGNNFLSTGSKCNIYVAGNLIKPDCSNSIVLKNNIWLSYGTQIKAGTNIGENSVALENAELEGEYSSNVLLSGKPAKVITNNISWGFLS